jgi:DNA-binding response OmpR family regulator
MQKILIVDDNLDILSVMEIILRKNNYEVVLENDGNKVFKKVKECLPDLILLDVGLGEINGIDICRQIRQAKGLRDIPIIIFSANIAYKKIHKECGDDFLMKPFETDQLLSRIHSFLLP